MPDDRGPVDPERVQQAHRVADQGTHLVGRHVARLVGLA
jgi:hypothetical protein